MLRITEADRQKDTGRHTDRQTGDQGREAERRGSGSSWKAGAAGEQEQQGRGRRSVCLVAGCLDPVYLNAVCPTVGDEAVWPGLRFVSLMFDTVRYCKLNRPLTRMHPP